METESKVQTQTLNQIQPEEINEPNAEEKLFNLKKEKDLKGNYIMSQSENYNQYNLQQKLDREHSQQHSKSSENQYISQTVKDQSEQNIANNQQEMVEQNQGEEQYQEYQEYGDEDGYQNYYNSVDEINLQKRHSSDHNYQYQMADLLHLINKEVKKVQELTGFSSDWALLYYQACGWKIPLVEKFIDQKGTNRSMINFNSGKAVISNIQGQCPICCLEEKIIYCNPCGDQFCEECWKNQLIQRMKYHKEPFPPCLNGDCNIKTSPFICNEISKGDSAFKALFERTLCRSYANGSTSVKICKGRQKVSCDKCFHIKKIFQLIQCQTCGNFVCARCGQEYHHPAQCYDGNNWRRVCQDSTSFIQNLDYRICPYCKEAVQRKSGCNSLVCTCKQTFCYICGQKWLPNHNQHGVCYRQAQIKKLRQQKLKKIENQKQYTDKLEKFKAELQPIISKIRKLQELDIQQQKSYLITQFHILSNQLHYFKQLKKKLQISLLVWKNSIISQYFTQNLIMKAHYQNMKEQLDKAYDFFLHEVPSLKEAFDISSKTTSKRIVQMRQQIKNPLQYLNECKLNMLNIIKKMDKFIDN